MLSYLRRPGTIAPLLVGGAVVGIFLLNNLDDPWSEGNGMPPGLAVGLSVFFGFGLALTPWIYGRRPTMARVCYFNAITGLVLTLVSIVGYALELEMFSNYSGGAAWIIGFLQLLCVIVSVPAALLVRKAKISATTSSSQSIEINISSILKSFENFQRIVRKERSEIEIVLQTTQSRLEAQFKEFRELERKLEESQAEAEQYRQIASMTKAQQEAFLRMLAKGKRMDYWVGLGLGLLSSALVAASSTLLKIW